MTEPLPPADLIDANELAALRLAAERYAWLRTHAVRIQDSEVWYSGAALDVRAGVGLEHVAFAKDVTPKRLKTRRSL
ncbi:hypothetical protein [Pseudomonas sp. MWU16-30317]|uniref:hypothetical protein n=1 Tax=Pseudomonas sp. MWU16-30317 TaxID=2878095 RepID=UPI001CFA3945|nr:hypothetical protein [Pseudomonas sp. MWU16-30317]